MSKGFAVQLRHVATETSWENVTEHGYIAVFDASGKELARRMGFQHNRKLRAGGAWDARAVEEVANESIKALTAPAAVKPASAAAAAIDPHASGAASA